MKDEEKTREQLMTENVELRRRIVELETTEKALRESELKYRLLFENANAGIIYFDTAGNYLMLNKYIAGMLGGQPDDFIGKSLHEVFPDQADFHLQRFANIIRDKKGASFEDPFPPVGRYTLVFLQSATGF